MKPEIIFYYYKSVVYARFRVTGRCTELRRRVVLTIHRPATAPSCWMNPAAYPLILWLHASRLR